MKFNKFIAIAAFTALGSVSNFAAAQSQNLGILNSADSTSINSWLASLDTIGSPWYTSTSFSQAYSFSVNSAANFFVTGGFSGSVTSGSLTLTGPGYTGEVLSWNNTPIALTNGGPYTLTVAGVASAYGGGFNGDLRNSVAAVPEPETIAMLLAGLGLIGLVTRRRNKLSVA